MLGVLRGMLDIARGMLGVPRGMLGVPRDMLDVPRGMLPGVGTWDMLGVPPLEILTVLLQGP